jgi:hypothetical protein
MFKLVAWDGFCFNGICLLAHGFQKWRRQLDLMILNARQLIACKLESLISGLKVWKTW